MNKQVQHVQGQRACHRHVTRAIHPDRNGATEPLPRRVPVDGLGETLQDIFVPSYTHLVPFPRLDMRGATKKTKDSMRPPLPLLLLLLLLFLSVPKQQTHVVTQRLHKAAA